MRTNIHKLALIAGIGSVSALGLWTSPDKLQPSKVSPIPAQANRATGQLPEGFVYLVDVDPTIRQEVRYAGKHNFVGRPIKGYERATVILTTKAAKALAAVQAALQKASKGEWTLKVYDGYRPQRAVEDFWRWSQDVADQTMKAEFYPDIADKTTLFTQGYIGRKSGHSRGSTVDLTIVSIDEEHLPAQTRHAEGLSDTYIDMGSPFDLFGSISHYESEKISAKAQENRKYLRDLMVVHGFVPYAKEWWHFTLQDESFPNTYFDFPVR